MLGWGLNLHFLCFLIILNIRNCQYATAFACPYQGCTPPGNPGQQWWEPCLMVQAPMFCCPRCSHLSTILNNVVEPESGVTILFNIVDSYEQCGQQNIVQSCFHQYCINLSVFTRVCKSKKNWISGSASMQLAKLPAQNLLHIN